MSVYRRYFRITEGPMVDEIDRLQDLLGVAAVHADKVAKQVGGEFKTWQSSGHFAGFTFKETPCQKTYRLLKKHGLWVPRKNTPEGKEVWAAIDQVPLPAPTDSALKLADLSANFPALFDGGKWYAPNLWGYGKPVSVWFVSVPWLDVDPADLEAYKAERDAKTRRDTNLDHLTWTAPEGWVEVKRWQIEKEAEEIDAAKKAEAAGLA
jgi:hypothetical protein